jgi:hypothetical protein
MDKGGEAKGKVKMGRKGGEEETARKGEIGKMRKKYN